MAPGLQRLVRMELERELNRLIAGQEGQGNGGDELQWKGDEEWSPSFWHRQAGPQRDVNALLKGLSRAARFSEEVRPS